MVSIDISLFYNHFLNNQDFIIKSIHCQYRHGVPPLSILSLKTFFIHTLLWITVCVLLLCHIPRCVQKKIILKSPRIILHQQRRRSGTAHFVRSNNKYLNPWNSLLIVLKNPEIMRCFMHFRFLSCSPIRCSFSCPSPRPPSQREGGDFRGRRQACCARLPPGWNENPEGLKKDLIQFHGFRKE